MDVELLECTADPDELSTLAAWTCHREDIPDKSEIDTKTVTNILDKALSSGHVGVTEHVSFTFGVEDVSRVLTHQLVRHRIASYDQQSQREVDMESTKFVKPSTIANSEFEKTFEVLIDLIMEQYEDMQAEGIPNEDARFILPNATTSNIVITMNARTLNHFFRLRCCRRAQWEIRELAWRMLKECKKEAPKIFETAGPSCLHGECPEGEFSCGEPFTTNEATNIFDDIDAIIEGMYTDEHLFKNEIEKEETK